jgi:hypothetical protein
MDRCGKCGIEVEPEPAGIRLSRTSCLSCSMASMPLAYQTDTHAATPVSQNNAGAKAPILCEPRRQRKDSYSLGQRRPLIIRLWPRLVARRRLARLLSNIIFKASQGCLQPCVIVEKFVGILHMRTQRLLLGMSKSPTRL